MTTNKEFFQSLILKPISVENINNYVNEFSIWKALCSNFNKVGEKFKIRNEPNASAVISYYRGRLWLKDFGTTKPSMLWEKYVMEEYNLKYYQALSLIANIFELKFLNQDYNIKRTFNSVKLYDDKKISYKEHQPTTIKYKSRPWNSWDIDKEYWFKKYEITKDDLELFYIKALSHYWLINGSEYMFTVYKDNPVYMYLVKGYKKLYSPLTKNKQYKWVSNVPKDIIFAEHLLPEKGNLLILESSLKDCIITHKLGYNAIPLPSETTFITEEKLIEYKQRFNRIVCHLNNDKPGIEAAKKWKELYQVDYFYNPLNTPKDSSDFVEKLGYQQLNQVFINNLY